MRNTPVHHPSHYNTPPAAACRPALRALLPSLTDTVLDGGIECIAAMAFFPSVIYFGWLYLSGFKYLWRAGQKGDFAEDIEKTRKCLGLSLDVPLPTPMEMLKARAQKAIEELPES